MSGTLYGGQAVIEGVMMQGPEGKAIACRREQGEIVYKIERKPSLKERYPIVKLPVIRGCVSFAMSLASGMRDLGWSATQAGGEEEEMLSTRDLVIAVVLAVVLALGFFVALPVFVATLAVDYIGHFGRSLLEGLLRVGLFLGYVIIIGRMPDIQRVFAYHGAEHKTINAYEAGEELLPENVRRHSVVHTRCGTSFILMTVLLMIIIFTFVGQTGAFARVLIKLASMPLVAGLAYELYRLPLMFPKSLPVRILTAPGLAVQRLTTREPDDAQIEVAICALTAVPGFKKTDGESEYKVMEDKTIDENMI
ncbi:MAG: DUF1385 domain-containing protein [Clostridiales bacterium]|nr:DUF1385 domain-containing protein [Clostridiales bacterium]